MTSRTKRRGFTLVEVLIGLVLSSVVLLVVVQFAKNLGRGSTSTAQSGSLEARLARFETMMKTDLARAGSDPTGQAMRVYRVKNGLCSKDYFHYGLVKDPAQSNCTTKIGDLGIVSYQGIDVDRNRIFYPEEGLNLSNPVLRPPAPTGITPAAPQPLPVNFYNDYIVYAFDRTAQTVVRQNLGSPDTTVGDATETVLTGVLALDVSFEDGPVPDTDPISGTYYSIVTVHVTIRADKPEAGYANPNVPAGSAYTAYRTAERSFSHHVLLTALSVN